MEHNRRWQSVLVIKTSRFTEALLSSVLKRGYDGFRENVHCRVCLKKQEGSCFNAFQCWFMH